MHGADVHVNFLHDNEHERIGKQNKDRYINGETRQSDENWKMQKFEWKLQCSLQ